MDAPVLIANGLVKTYRRGPEVVQALRGVDLTVARGSFVAVVGRSGSGKSTLLHLLGGLDRPTEGEVLLEGRNLSMVADDELTLIRRRRIGFVFQFFNLLPGLPAWQNIALPLLVDGVSPRDCRRAASRLAERLEIVHRLDAPVASLSGGEMQRCALARALVRDPAIVLADEPTGNLDRQTAQQVVALLRALVSDDGHTVVMVTHDESAAGIADRVLLLDDGRLVRELVSQRV